MTSIFTELLSTFDKPQTAHAAMVHLPIALTLIAPIFLLVAGLLPGRRRMGAFLATIAYAVLAIATLVTIQSGEAAYDAIGDVGPALGTMAHEHGEMSERIWTWGLIAALISAVGLFKDKKKLALGAVWTAFAFGMFTAGWAALAAHKGGVLVYAHGLGTPNPVLDDGPDQGTGDPRMDRFLADVRPVLIDRCVGCHRDGREESGLNMSSMTKILEGAEHGLVLKPGYPEASMIMTVIRGDHPEIDRMPKGKGGPLTPKQIEAIRRWIEDGAVWGE